MATRKVKFLRKFDRIGKRNKYFQNDNRKWQIPHQM